MFQKFSGAKKFRELKGGVSRFSVEKFFSHSAEIFQGNLVEQCFRNFPVAKKFVDKRGGGYQDFPSEYFSLTVPKNFAGESFTVPLISGIEKS